MNDIIAFLMQHWMLTAGLASLVVALLINEMRHFSACQAYTPQEVVNQMNHHKAKLIDCREPAAFQAGHILGAVNIPKLKFQDSQGMLSVTQFQNKAVILICHQGTDSPKIATKLRKTGFKEVAILEGGLQAWKKEGLPIERS